MEKTLTIENKTGLHARPASMFVQTANKFKAKIKLTAKGKTVDAKSILMIMSLGLQQGTDVTISADGEDAQAALDALTDLVKSKFGED
ncbi:HPr family phosphocarrier protein [Pectinatus haikarae]|uniref:Phosphocarrier protein HPr n=1 Tax=Pectinatus haikarae TaxID=349096 RepID=A0ABT9Y601_9FIRM|nr:HPr family phosphocarrier protein [Pectinatus haikarae]MDQ0203258.1 phosphocarrier protein [Pectinatus haikarae]